MHCDIENHIGLSVDELRILIDLMSYKIDTMMESGTDANSLQSFKEWGEKIVFYCELQENLKSNYDDLGGD